MVIVARGVNFRWPDGALPPPRGRKPPPTWGTAPMAEAFSLPYMNAAAIVYLPASWGARSVQVTLASGKLFWARSDFTPKTRTKLRFFLSPSARESTHLVCSVPSGPMTLGDPTTTHPSEATGRAWYRRLESRSVTPTTGPAPPLTVTVTVMSCPRAAVLGADRLTVELASITLRSSTSFSRSAWLRSLYAPAPERMAW